MTLELHFNIKNNNIGQTPYSFDDFNELFFKIYKLLRKLSYYSISLNLKKYKTNNQFNI